MSLLSRISKRRIERKIKHVVSGVKELLPTLPDLDFEELLRGVLDEAIKREMLWAIPEMRGAFRRPPIKEVLREDHHPH